MDLIRLRNQGQASKCWEPKDKDQKTDMIKTNYTAENSMYNGEAKPSYFFVIMIIYIILCTNLDNFTPTLLYFYTYEPKVEIYVSIIKTLQFAFKFA